MMRHLLTLIYLLTISVVLYGQPGKDCVDSIPFVKMSLEDLMQINISVASKSPMNSREAPGIVTIITEEEIRKSGSNDLMQVLQQVSGLDFGVDVDGIVGMGVRGNWGHEGKILMLWDGMEMNEDLYSTLQFGMHYPLDHVKQIEVIRGPGSSIYGGNAEYAVINIITRNNEKFNGLYVNAINSWLKNTNGTHGISIAGGKSFGDAHINLSTSYYDAIRSDQEYTDYNGKTYDMSNQSRLSNTQYRLDFFLKGLTVTGLYDMYSVDQRDGYDRIYIRHYKTEFNTGHISANYRIKINEKLIVTPGLRVKIEQPWSYRKNILDDNFHPFNTTVNKKVFYLNTVYDPSQNVNISTGLEYYNLLAHENIDTNYFNNGKKNFSVDNYSLYVQSIIKFNWINLIAGSRIDYNPFNGACLVPRIGLTRVWDNFHFKTLYSLAFRTPSIENMNVSPGIKSEQTRVAEIEVGLRLASRSYLTANVYDISTSNTILFYYDDNLEDQYKNERLTGTRGFEIEYKWKSEGWYTLLNYSYFTTAGHPVIYIYQSPGHEGSPLAFPAHELNLSSNIRLFNGVEINPSATYFSKRYSYLEKDNGAAESIEYPQTLYCNLALNFDNLFYKGVLFQVSSQNITDSKVYFIQPYNGGHMPLPGSGRSIQLKLTYLFSFKDK